MSLGARLADGRRVGIEWRRRRTTRGTVVHAVITHDGELSAADMAACLGEICEGEGILAASRRGRRGGKRIAAS